MGECRRAINDYDTAVRLDPNDAITYYNRGLAYDDMGEPRRAVEDYDMAISIDPAFGLAYLFRGAALGQLGRMDEARADINRASGLGVDASLTQQVTASLER